MSLGIAPSGVVTLSFGTFANHVQAHYWNIQDDAYGTASSDDGDMDWRVEYAEREGQGKESASYVPRVVMFDLCGDAKVGSHRDEKESTREAALATTSWGGRVEVCRASVAKRSAFAQALERESRAVKAEAEAKAEKAALSVFDDEDEETGRRSKLGAVGRALERGSASNGTNDASRSSSGQVLDSPEDIVRALVDGAGKLDEDADHWSDYLKVDVHERSVFKLTGKWSDIDAFSGFGEGLDWIDTEDRREDVRESVRYWAEDCDTLGGFHIAVDDSSGFGGVCSRAMEDIKDDYNNAPICVFSVKRPEDIERKRIDMLNAAFMSTMLANNADLFCPLAACDTYPMMPGLRAQNWFHTSSVVALAMETITTPWRLKATTSSGTSTLGRLSLHDMARHMTNRAPGSRVSAHMSNPVPPVASPADAEILMKSLRGMTPNEIRRACSDDDVDVDDRPFAESFVFRGIGSPDALDSSAIVEISDAAFSRELYRCPRHRCATRTPVSIPLPYPKLFDSNDPASVSSFTRLTSGASSARALSIIESDARRAAHSAVGKAVLRAWACDHTEFEETCETLRTHARAFAGLDDGE